MKFERKHAWTLIAIAAWNVVTWVTFIRNLAATEGRPRGYYIAHTVLIVVNLVIAAVLGAWGARALKNLSRTPRDRSPASAGSAE